MAVKGVEQTLEAPVSSSARASRVTSISSLASLLHQDCPPNAPRRNQDAGGLHVVIDPSPRDTEAALDMLTQSANAAGVIVDPMGSPEMLRSLIAALPHPLDRPGLLEAILGNVALSLPLASPSPPHTAAKTGPMPAQPNRMLWDLPHQG